MLRLRSYPASRRLRAGLVFAGDMSGNVYALDSDDGKVVFKYATGGAVAGGVITYRIGETQYLAVTSGNVSRLVWGETGLPSIVIFRLGSNLPSATQATVETQRVAHRRPQIAARGGNRSLRAPARSVMAAAGEGLTGPSLKTIGKRLSPPELSAWIMNPVARRDSPAAASDAATVPVGSLTEQDVFDVAAMVGIL